jgi:hypothetical protein
MKPVEKVLGRLEGVVESSSSWKALCSAHDAREPSLSSSRLTTVERSSSASLGAKRSRSLPSLA